MQYHVYLIVSKTIKDKIISYVGYTNNLQKRLDSHNNSKGAKFTRGKKWYLAYSKKYKTKSKAMKEEYKLKKERIFRSKIKDNFVVKYKSIFEQY